MPGEQARAAPSSRCLPTAVIGLLVVCCGCGSVRPIDVAAGGEHRADLVWGAGGEAYLWVKGFIPHDGESWEYGNVRVEFDGAPMTFERAVEVPAACAYPGNASAFSRSRRRWDPGTQEWRFRQDTDDILNNGTDGRGVARELTVTGLTPYLIFRVSDVVRPGVNTVTLRSGRFPFRITDLRLVSDYRPLLAREKVRQAPFNPPWAPIPVAGYFLAGLGDVDAFISSTEAAGAPPPALAMAYRAKSLVCLAQGDREAGAVALRRAIDIGLPPPFDLEAAFFLDRLADRPCLPPSQAAMAAPPLSPATPDSAVPLADRVRALGQTAVCFKARDLGPGRTTATRPTQAWAAYDKDALYLVFACQGVAAADMRPVEGPHDVRVFRGECTEVFLFPDFLPPYIYELDVSASGVRFDSREMFEGTCDVSWNGAWSAEVRSGDDGWTCEYGIPWAALGRAQPRPGDVWGIGLTRGSRITGDASVQWQTWPVCKYADFHDIRWYALLEFK